MDQHKRSDELKSRLRATQEQNEVMYNIIQRTKKMIQRARLERALLQEKIEQVTKGPVEDLSPPDSPIDVEKLPSEPLSDRGSELPGSSGTIKRTGGNKLPNAYTVFCDEERWNVQQELEDTQTPMKHNTVQKALTERWKSMTKEQKKPYTEKAREIKKKGGEESEEEKEEFEEFQSES